MCNPIVTFYFYQVYSPYIQYLSNNVETCEQYKTYIYTSTHLYVDILFIIYSCIFVLSKLDYCGIAVLTMGSFVPWLYYGFYCQFFTKIFYLVAILLLGKFCRSNFVVTSFLLLPVHEHFAIYCLLSG